uniref:Uncharacterized protein n=1 Tax=Acrobeloides nanus TaxID=290746 RepID=A0A914D0F9_9BILA
MYSRAVGRVFARYLIASGPIRLRSPCPNLLSVGPSTHEAVNFRLFASQTQENNPEKPIVPGRKLVNLIEKSFVEGERSVDLALQKSEGDDVFIKLSYRGLLLLSGEEAVVFLQKLDNIIGAIKEGRNEYLEEYEVKGRKFKLYFRGVEVLKIQRISLRNKKIGIMIPLQAVSTVRENLAALLEEYEKLKKEGKLTG